MLTRPIKLIGMPRFLHPDRYRDSKTRVMLHSLRTQKWYSITLHRDLAPPSSSALGQLRRPKTEAAAQRRRRLAPP